MMAEKFMVKCSKDNKYYFTLVAPNGEPVAVSETYNSKAACINGIEAVKKYAPTATIVEETTT